MSDEVTEFWQRERSSAGWHTTRWTQVLATRDRETPEAAQALETLCRHYWVPVYTWIRRQGHRPDAAQDLTQTFFTELLQRETLTQADPDRGRFRAFLKTLVKHFLANQARQAGALKRGGHLRQLSLDWQSGEERMQFEPQDGETPDTIFEREWALSVLHLALEGLRDEYVAKGRGDWFDVLRPALVPSDAAPSYAEVAERLGLSVTAVKVALHRLRDRFRQRLRFVVADTLQAGEDIDDEIRQLLQALRQDQGASGGAV